MTDLVPLAVLMGLATYPSRAIPLLLAHVRRLPPPVLAYLRLVGPAVLAALAAVNTVVAVETVGETRTASFHAGIEWAGVLAGLAVVLWRRNLLLGIVAGAGVVAAARAAGLA